MMEADNGKSNETSVTTTDSSCFNDDGNDVAVQQDEQIQVTEAVEVVAEGETEDPWKNRNVQLSFVLCILSGIADSVWNAVVLTGFLYALAQYTDVEVWGFHQHDNGSDDSTSEDNEANTLVGFAEAVQGLSQLVFALPLGILADLTGKARVVASGGALMLVAIVLTLVGIHMALEAERDQNDQNEARMLFSEDGSSSFSANRAYIIMLVVLGLWGVVGGISYGPSQALFSDSIRKGRRSELLTWLYSCYLMSSTVGPILTILLLTAYRKQDSWSLEEMSPVFVVGILLEIPAAIAMFFFSEKYVVDETEEVANGDDGQEMIADGAPAECAQTCDGESEETSTATSQGQSEQTGLMSEEQQQQTRLISEQDRRDSQKKHIADQLEVLGISINKIEDITEDGDSNVGDNDDNGMVAVARRTYEEYGTAAIPYFLFGSSLVISIGSGASVKYFPLFFKELGFESEVVQGIFLAVPISISTFSFIAQRASRAYGRIETCLGFYAIGVSLLFYMTYLSRDEKDLTGFGRWYIAVVYLVRTGIMNCPYPLLESVLMDSVPSNRRARWKSLESIAAFGWTGSALAGGILADNSSYRSTFCFTAALQLSGALLLAPIGPFVETENAGDSSTEESSEEDSNNNTTENSDPAQNVGTLSELQEPLLGNTKASNEVIVAV